MDRGRQNSASGYLRRLTRVGELVFQSGVLAVDVSGELTERGRAPAWTVATSKN